VVGDGDTDKVEELRTGQPENGVVVDGAMLTAAFGPGAGAVVAVSDTRDGCVPGVGAADRPAQPARNAPMARTPMARVRVPPRE
jgi:hypothetical protein